MGKSNGNSWLNAVRKAFRSPSKVDREEKDDQEEDRKRGKRRWMFLKNNPLETTIQHSVGKTRTDDQNVVVKQAKVDTSVPEQRCAIAVAMATAEAAVATAQAAVDIIHLTTKPSPIFLEEHKAALVIQTIFRGYLARRALMALKGIVKLQALIRAHIVRRRAKMTLQCIQSLVRVQAHVCDQRRRRSCEATSLGPLFSQGNSSKKSTVGTSFIEHSKPFANSTTSDSNDSVDVLTLQLSYSGNHHQRAVEEIQVLIQNGRECSFKQGKKTLGHVLSQQIWTLDEEQFSDNNCEELEGNRSSVRQTRKDRTLCSLTVQSPKTPSSSKANTIGVHSCSQTTERNYQSAETPTSRSIYYHRMSMSESSCPLPRPNYMAATASAMARVRSQSTPRNRPPSPSRDQTGCSAKKCLSFPVTDPQNADDKASNRRYKSICAKQFGDEQRLDVPCYLTE